MRRNRRRNRQRARCFALLTHPPGPAAWRAHRTNFPSTVRSSPRSIILACVLAVRLTLTRACKKAWRSRLELTSSPRIAVAFNHHLGFFTTHHHITTLRKQPHSYIVYIYQTKSHSLATAMADYVCFLPVCASVLPSRSSWLERACSPTIATSSLGASISCVY